MRVMKVRDIDDHEACERLESGIGRKNDGSEGLKKSNASLASV